MSYEQVDAFCIYLSDNIVILLESGINADEAVKIAKRDWDDMSNDIKMVYIEKEIKLYMNNRKSRVSFLNFER